jgi:hypothetical protein
MLAVTTQQETAPANQSLFGALVQMAEEFSQRVRIVTNITRMSE